MTLIHCPSTCCDILTKAYKHTRKRYPSLGKRDYRKAGAFIYDPRTQRILLVQSRGDKWGAPKGSMEDTDTSIHACAIREVYEETGIRLDRSQLNRMYRIDKTVYFYIELDQQAVGFDICTMHDNDATGITWIRPQCLAELHRNGQLHVNVACKKLMRKFLPFHVL